MSLIAPLLQILTHPHQLGTGVAVIDRLLPYTGLHDVTTAILVIAFAMICLKAVTVSAAHYATWLTTDRIMHDVRMRVVDQLQSVSLDFYVKTSSAEIFNTLFNELSSIRSMIQLATSLCGRVFVLIAYVCLCVWLSWQVSLLAVCLFALVVYLPLSFLSRFVKKRARETSQAANTFARCAVEIVRGIRTITEFCAQDFERERYRTLSESLATRMTASDNIHTTVLPVTETLGMLAFVAIMCISLHIPLVSSTRIPTSSLLTVLFLIFRMIPLMNQLHSGRLMVAGFSASAHRVEDLLNSQDKKYIQDGALLLESFSCIQFANVSFSYGEKDLALTDVSFSVPRGKTVAIVGASGSGKTTLMNLLPRFYDPQSGCIYIDGTPLTAFMLRSLRSRIAIVSQDTFLFDQSIRENIVYGLRNVTDEDVYEAAQRAQALEFILQLPQQFDSLVGEGGVRLSVGQRQRIAVARALLRKPEILLLDEATSALDGESEKALQEALHDLMQNKTVIMIAHRISTVISADRLIILERGRVVEQGTYKELLEKKGQLWKYHRLQYGLADVLVDGG